MTRIYLILRVFWEELKSCFFDANTCSSIYFFAKIYGDYDYNQNHGSMEHDYLMNQLYVICLRVQGYRNNRQFIEITNELSENTLIGCNDT